jgi:hypothetical protein
MSVSLDRGTTIGRLRLVAATADPNALRMRGGTVLGALDLQPPAMPEQAVLCIRKLQDPLPGGLDLRSSATLRPAAWEAAMRSAVGHAFHRAVRPALGPVPANADAVLFADRAELLACAARDALGGALAIQWWWTHLLGERSVAAVVREWTRAPAYVPAAVEMLTARGEVAAFARHIAAGEAVRLVETVLRAHSLPALAFDVVNALTASFSLRPTKMTEQQPPSPDVLKPRAEILATAPWRSIAPDLAPAMLNVEQQSLIAIALVLRRAPALARSERFAREVVVWIESARWSDVPAEPHTAEREAPTAMPKLRAAELRQPAETLPAASGNVTRKDIAPKPHPPTPSPISQSPAPGRGGATAQNTREQGDGGSPTPGGDRVGDGREVLGVRLRSETGPIFETPSETASPEPQESSPIATEPQPIDPDIAIDSDFAGVFFLLNVAIDLGLYSDFTSPVQRGISLDVWDFLALTGAALAAIAGLEDDPIGPLLATLANRKEGEPPGTGFVPPDDLSMSEWLDVTVSRIRDRLALAGIEDPPRVVRRYGRITTTPAHLDVYFSLAAHPIEIRLAGLDRNPGWIPAAGRHVAFHFD